MSVFFFLNWCKTNAGFCCSAGANGVIQQWKGTAEEAGMQTSAHFSPKRTWPAAVNSGRGCWFCRCLESYKNWAA